MIVVAEHFEVAVPLVTEPRVAEMVDLQSPVAARPVTTSTALATEVSPLQSPKTPAPPMLGVQVDVVIPALVGNAAAAPASAPSDEPAE